MNRMGERQRNLRLTSTVVVYGICKNIRLKSIQMSMIFAALAQDLVKSSPAKPHPIWKLGAVIIES